MQHDYYTWFWARWVILGVCWGLFVLVWIVGAVYNFFKAPAVQKRSSSIYPWLIGGILIVMVWNFVPQRFWAFLTFETSWLRIIGIVLLLVSTAFTLWARQVLGTMWTITAVAKEGHALRTNGPYHISRHPIYTGLLGMLVGSMLISGLGEWIFYLLVGIAVLEAKIASEEQLLTETFGTQYIEYKQRIPQLIPGLHWFKTRRNTGGGERTAL